MKGKRVCKMHGGGTRKRVREGDRKPPGRPPTTGEYVDINKTQYTRLREIAATKVDDPELLNTRRHIAMMDAVFELALEKWRDGLWDAVKSVGPHGTLYEHPESWMIERKEAVIRSIDRALKAAFRDHLHAAALMLEPFVKAVDDAIERFVPPDQREAFRSKLRQAAEGFTLLAR